MKVTAFRVQHFMGFEDSGWLELRPITLLFGRNSSGKSALIRALLLLRQSLKMEPGSGALLFVSDDGYDFGDYTEMVKDHDRSKHMSFWFKIRFEPLESVVDSGFIQHKALESVSHFVDLESRSDLEKLDMQVITVRLIIGLDGGEMSELKGLDILDSRGNIIFRADKPERNENNSNGWLIATDFFDPGERSEVWDNIEIFIQENFLPRMRILESVQGFQEDGISFGELESFGENFQNIWYILYGIRNAISKFLEQIDYLGPLRSLPQRYYYIASQSAASPERSRYFVRNLVKADATNLDMINRWLTDLRVPCQIELQPLDAQKRLYELRLREGDGEQTLSANIREVGFGLAQMLPVVVQAVLAQPGNTLIIEQPELHLHPRAQADLTDLFIAMSHRGLRFLIETHSEHMLLRLRRRIAETAAGLIARQQPEHLVSDSLIAYFVDRTDGSSTAERITIDHLGKMSSPPGFKGFFADDLMELAQLNNAVMKAQEDEVSQ